MTLDFAHFSEYVGVWLNLLLGFSLKGAVIVAVAGLLAVALRRASAASRHLVWNMALAALLALPLVSFFMPAWNVAILPEIATNERIDQKANDPSQVSLASIPETEQADRSITVAAEGEVAPVPSVETSQPVIAETESAGNSVNHLAVTQSAPFGWQFWALTIWLAGAFVVAMRMLAGTIGVWWIVRRARPVEDDSWRSLAEFLAWQLELKRPVRLLESSSLGMPITCGVFRSVVLIPQNADEWTDERRQVVLSHELAHVKRRDCLTQMLAQMACALYWFNPLIWIAARRLRVERELACDDYVLSTGTKASDYADHLLDLARGMKSAHLSSLTAVAIARRSQLEGRLLAILDPGLKRCGLNRAATVIAAAVLACVVLPLAALRPATRAEASSVASQSAESSTQPHNTATEQTGNINHGVTDLSQKKTEDSSESEAADQNEDLYVESNAENPENPDQQKNDGAVTEGVAGVVAEILAGQDSKESVRQGVIEGLKEALKDDDPQVRKEAMRALGLAGGKEVVAVMIEALKDRDPATRKHAAWALGMRGNQEAVEPLIGALRDENAQVREQAAWALGLKGDSRAVEPLINALNDAEPQVRERVAWALGLKGDHRAVDVLMAALRDSNSQVRERAAWALGLKGDRRAVDALTSALSDSSPQVREQAAWALGLKGDSRAVEALINALSDSSEQVREQAAWALGMRGDARAMNALKTALKDSNKQVREQAAWALGMILMKNGRGMNLDDCDSCDSESTFTKELKAFARKRQVLRNTIRTVSTETASRL